MSDSNSSRSGIGICGTLFLVFLTLKVVGVAPVAGWSWWWVTAPLWVGLAIAAVVLIILWTVVLLLDR